MRLIFVVLVSTTVMLIAAWLPHQAVTA